MTPEAQASVLEPLVRRFAKAFGDFVNEVTKAVLEASMDPALSSTPALLAWQTRALPLLERQDAAIQNALALFLVGETQTVVGLARNTGGLDKQLDGFSLGFAGPKYAELLDRLENAVVGAAYQLESAARNH